MIRWLDSRRNCWIPCTCSGRKDGSETSSKVRSDISKGRASLRLLLRRDYPSDGYHRLRDLEDDSEEEQSRRDLDAGELLSHVFKLYCLSHVFKAAFR